MNTVIKLMHAEESINQRRQHVGVPLKKGASTTQHEEGDEVTAPRVPNKSQSQEDGATR